MQTKRAPEVRRFTGGVRALALPWQATAGASRSQCRLKRTRRPCAGRAALASPRAMNCLWFSRCLAKSEAIVLGSFVMTFRDI
jgi:hypothetical protein